MGYNTVLEVSNDAIHMLKDDDTFGERLYRAILEFRPGARSDVAIGNHVNACSVISQAHADYTQVVAVGGNYGSLLGIVPGYVHHTEEAKERLLRHLASDLGYDLHKKRRS